MSQNAPLRTMSRPSLSILSSGLLLVALAVGACQSSGSGSGASGASTVLEPQAGTSLLVTGGSTLSPGEYLLPPVGGKGEQGVLRLVGLKDMTLDLGRASMRGTPVGTNPDKGMGWGLVLEDCENVVVRGGSFGGYRACVVLNNCRNVTLDGLQFDSWYAARLYSTTAAEGSSDWLRPHENDLGEWTREYGAAISANDCEGLVIRNCKGRHGQNGIVLTRSNGCEVYDCDFSFLSGWGLALYRASRNKISHNIFDYCVRGYSHGVYWRGQDSAGILMFERCSDNVIAYNSATHGGDGVFLFAGQDLVEGRALARGELEDPGGSDRNLFYGNDLRFSVANSLEATFSSDNVLVKNRLSGSHQHGVWGGYSKRMVIVDNEINDTLGGAITIEHGQDCFFGWNEMSGNEMGVEVYWDPDAGLVQRSHFGKTRDTSSRDHWIVGNNFTGNDQDLVIRETRGVSLSVNLFSPGARPFLSEVTAEGRDNVQEETLLSWLAGRDGLLPSGNLALASLRPLGDQPADLVAYHTMPPPVMAGQQVISAEERGEFKGGLETIIMGEWGPWDFRSGEPRPSMRRAGGLLAESRWDARWFRWDSETEDPRGDQERWRGLADDPIASATVDNFTTPWGSDKIRRSVGENHFGLLASTDLQLATAGTYLVAVNSDDGVRLSIDGLVVFEDWTWHAPQRGEASIDLAAGKHHIELEYFQIDGAFALSVELFRQEN